MIEISGLNKTFGKKDGDVHAVNNLTITFNEGVTGLVGENGAGKSTLFRLIADIIERDSGNILIDGKDNRTKEAKADIFLLPDEPYAPGRYNAMEVANLYNIFYQLDMNRFKSLLEQSSLPANHPISSFSKGMRRQLFLFIAFSVKCKNILLDEAFDGLDPLVIDTIGKEIIKLVADEHKTIILSSHNMSSVQKIADSITILYRGKVSESKEKVDIGTEIVKYQLISKETIDGKSLEELGLKPISITKIGSITTIVLLKKDNLEDIIRERYSPSLLEQCPLETSEIIAMEMLLARKGDIHE